MLIEQLQILTRIVVCPLMYRPGMTTEGRVLVVSKAHERHVIKEDGTNPPGTYHHCSLFAVSDGQRHDTPIWIHYLHTDVLALVHVRQEQV